MCESWGTALRTSASFCPAESAEELSCVLNTPGSRKPALTEAGRENSQFPFPSPSGLGALSENEAPARSGPAQARAGGGGHFRPRAPSRSAGRAAATPSRKGAGPQAGSGRLHNGGGGARACVTRRLPAAPAAPYITGVRAAGPPQ